jgi:heavy metal efflux system protein
VRFAEPARRDRDAIGRLLVSAPGGERVPLGSLAGIEESEGPAETSHLNGSRVIMGGG